MFLSLSGGKKETRKFILILRWVIAIVPVLMLVSHLTARSEFGRNTLCQMAAENEWIGMELFLAAGADPDGVGITGSAVGTPLEIAASHGSPDAIDELVEAGANINRPNKEGLTALDIVALSINGPIIDRGRSMSIGILARHGGYCNRAKIDLRSFANDATIPN